MIDIEEQDEIEDLISYNLSYGITPQETLNDLVIYQLQQDHLLYHQWLHYLNDKKDNLEPLYL